MKKRRTFLPPNRKAPTRRWIRRGRDLPPGPTRTQSDPQRPSAPLSGCKMPAIPGNSSSPTQSSATWPRLPGIRMQFDQPKQRDFIADVGIDDGGVNKEARRAIMLDPEELDAVDDFRFNALRSVCPAGRRQCASCLSERPRSGQNHPRMVSPARRLWNANNPHTLQGSDEKRKWLTEPFLITGLKFGWSGLQSFNVR